MIVSNNSIQNVTKAYSDQTKVSKKIKSESSSTTQSPDEVILSSQAQEFGGIISKLQALPDVRADKVSDLGDQVAAGSYHVAAYDIAGRMLSE